MQAVTPVPVLPFQPNPTPLIDKLVTSRGHDFHVLREDLLIGGTKQRAAFQYVTLMKKSGVQELCYASPFAGFAQVALAVCCQALELPCHIFAERDKSQAHQGPSSARALHPFSKLAKDLGAHVHLFDSLDDAERASASFSSRRFQSKKIPLGFNCPAYLTFFEENVAKIWKQLTSLGLRPERIWVPVGSGTLALTLRAALPPSVRLECLDVRVLPLNDPRLLAVARLPNTTLRHVPELFHERAGLTPPIPSNLHYDAKLWRYLRSEAAPSDLWWNVAR